MICPHCEQELDAEISDVLTQTRGMLTQVIESAQNILMWGTPAEKTRLTTTILGKLMAIALNEEENIDESVKEDLDALMKELSGGNDEDESGRGTDTPVSVAPESAEGDHPPGGSG